MDKYNFKMLGASSCDDELKSRSKILVDEFSKTIDSQTAKLKRDMENLLCKQFETHKIADVTENHYANTLKTNKIPQDVSEKIKKIVNDYSTCVPEKSENFVDIDNVPNLIKRMVKDEISEFLKTSVINESIKIVLDFNEKKIDEKLNLFQALIYYRLRKDNIRDKIRDLQSSFEICRIKHFSYAQNIKNVSDFKKQFFDEFKKHPSRILEELYIEYQTKVNYNNSYINDENANKFIVKKIKLEISNESSINEVESKYILDAIKKFNDDIDEIDKEIIIIQNKLKYI